MHYVDQYDHIFSKTTFKRAGLTNARLIGIESIRSTRIKFSIPVLMRSTAAENICYDNNFTYCADIDFELQLSYTGFAYFLSDYLIANRFHTGNATRRLLKENLKQLRAIAEKHDVRISFIDLIIFYVEGYFWMLVKKVFLTVYPVLAEKIISKKKAI
jgi:hypothetical protein